MNKLITAALVAALAVLTSRAGAVPAQDAVAAQADSTSHAAIVFGAAGGSSMANLYYLGSNTEALVTITSVAMTFYSPGTVLDTDVGTSGVIDLTAAAYDTMGELCDYINSLKNYRCMLTGSLRSDASGGASAVLKAQTATSGTCNLKSAGGCNLTNGAAGIIRLGIIPAPGRRVVLKAVHTVALATTDNVNVYGSLRSYGSGMTETGSAVTSDTKVYGRTPGSTSLTYIPAHTQYQMAPWLEFSPNNWTSPGPDGLQHNPVVGAKDLNGRVVVEISAVNSGSETASQYLSAFWDEK